METKKEILNLLYNINEGDYNNASDNVRKIIEHKLELRIQKLSKNK